MVPNRWLILSILFFARTAMGFQFQSIASVSPLLVHDLHIDFGLLGALIGAWMLPGAVLAIPGGLLGQRFGDKSVVLFGLFLMVAGSGVVAYADNYSVAMTGRVVSGAGAVLLNVLLTKMVADWFANRELATAMAILVVSWPFGIGLALVVLGPLAASVSWSAAIQATAWACAAALVGVALVYRRPPPSPGTSKAAVLSWRLTRREITLVGLAGGVWTLYNVGYIVVVSFAPVLLASKGFTTAGAALVASLATWPLVATIPFGGVLADRTGRGKQIMIGSLVAMAVSLPLMSLTDSPLGVLALIGVLTGPAGGIIMSLPARALRPEVWHLGMGLFFTLYYLGMALLPSVAGWVRDLTRWDAAPLLFGSALLLVGAVFAVLYHRLSLPTR